jgi:hypothetical protein
MATSSQMGSSPRAMMSFSTAWIRKFQKSDLELELTRVILSSEGSQDELWRRLNGYVRAHSKLYIRVNWIFRLDETT